MVERAPAKKATARKAPAVPTPTPENGAGPAVPAEPWPEDVLGEMVRSVLTVQTAQLTVLEKLLDVVTGHKDLTQAGTAEIVATRREVQTQVEHVRKVLAQVAPYMPQLIAAMPQLLALVERAKTMSTPGGFVKGLLSGAPPRKPGHRR